MIPRTFDLVFADTPGLLFRTSETADFETLASFAISEIVMRITLIDSNSRRILNPLCHSYTKHTLTIYSTGLGLAIAFLETRFSRLGCTHLPGMEPGTKVQDVPFQFSGDVSLAPEKATQAIAFYLENI